MEQETITIETKTSFDTKPNAGPRAVAGNVALLLFACALCIVPVLLWGYNLSPLVQLFIFLAAGILHVYLIREKVHFVSFTREWIYTLGATGLVVLLLYLASSTIRHLPLVTIYSSACAFLLPFTLSELWRTKLQVAYEGAQIWFPTEEEIQSHYPRFYYNSSNVRFRVFQGRGLATTVKFKVSNEMSLGKIFYDLAQFKSRREGKIISLTDSDQAPYRWVFFTTDWLFLNRSLDPEKTLGENKLKENSVIYVQKVYPGDVKRIKKFTF